MSIKDEIAKEGFVGDITFHQYSEPIMDPRLYYIVCEFRKDLPKCSISIWSNGSLLTPQLKADFDNLGVKYAISSDKKGMDDRLGLYEVQPSSLEDRPCPRIHQITITCDGDVAACCYDWRRTVTYGNVLERPFMQIINDSFHVLDKERLSSGARPHDVCRRCRTWLIF